MARARRYRNPVSLQILVDLVTQLMHLRSALRELGCRVKMINRTRGCSHVRHYGALNSQGYEDAIAALNSLQSNLAYIQEARKQSPSLGEKKLLLMWEYLDVIGVHRDDLSKLSFIHVAGTKGKGSTSAYCESILRQNGYRTGFFSSPHLVSVCERIRINGQSMPQDDFTKHFWPIYNKLSAYKSPEKAMPGYFAFITVMALSVFLSEKVDVAIMEVGIGGELDCTNVIPNPSIIGITSLGLDHIELLGDTMPKIAWQKAGIMKPSAIGFTVPDHLEDVLKVLGQRSVERQCPLEIAPTLEKYDWPDEKIHQEILSLVPAQKTNASLALQITHAWMKRQNNMTGTKPLPSLKLSKALPFLVTHKTAHGILACKWPGRLQTLESMCGRITYCLDGAHTKDSVLVCLNWFKRSSSKDKSHVQQALIFNVTGNRDMTQLLAPFISHHFDKVLFSPNFAYDQEHQGDRTNLNTTKSTQTARCYELQRYWEHLHNSTNCKASASNKVVNCVADAISELEKEGGEWRVLVTGSLHLIGALLSIVDPNLKRSESTYSL